MPPHDFTDEGSVLGEDDAEDLLRGIAFKTGPPRMVGVELEWLVHDLSDPEQPVPAHRLEEAFDGLRPCP